MTQILSPPPLDPSRFRSAAQHYEEGRAAYAEALLHRVAEVTGTGRAHRVLDLGCGPGPLARGFAPLVGEVVAVDPSPEMLAAARALAAGLENVRFVTGSSYDIGPQLGRFRLAVMGRSFHWMDRGDTLKRLDQMIEPRGAVALFHVGAPEVPANDWTRAWRDIRKRYEDDAGTRHRGPGWIRHEGVLLASRFNRLERFGVVERRPLDVETLVRRALSMSTTSRSRIGEDKAVALAADLRGELADVREEVVETEALVAWRSD